MGATGDYDSTDAPSSAPLSEPEAGEAEADSDSPEGHSPRPDKQDAT